MVRQRSGVSADQALAEADEHLVRAKTALMITDVEGRLRHLLDAVANTTDAAVIVCEGAEEIGWASRAVTLVDLALVRARLLRARRLVGVTRG